MSEGGYVAFAILIGRCHQGSSHEPEPFEETTESVTEFWIRT